MPDEEPVLIKKRSSMKAKLTNFSNHLDSLVKCTSLTDLQRIDLEGRLSKFDALYSEFDALQMNIEVVTATPDIAYAERAKFEERYHALLAQARSLLEANQPRARAGSGASSTDRSGGSCKRSFIRLPKIDLPHFNGSYDCWLEFRDTFLSLIHNSESIDDVSKFHYLRASLKGSAQELIKNIDFKGNNYSMAWNLLRERYDNSRLLINNHVKALFNATAITHESCASLRRLIDVINKNIRALKTLEEPTEHWDTLIIYMMSTKLDAVTCRNWEEHRNTLTGAPKLSQFCTFLSNKADLLETLEANQSAAKTNRVDTSSSKPNSFIIASQNSAEIQHKNNTYERNKPTIKCPLCSQTHLLYTCETFRSLSVEERIKKATEFRVCLNCLRLGHVTKRCRLSRCSYCKRKHNTLLHVESPETTPFQNPMPEPTYERVALPTDTSPDSVVLSTDATVTQQQDTPSVQTLLSTALVKVVGAGGQRFDARILLDNGSTANFATHALCNKLQVPRRNNSSTVSGINGQTCNSKQSCNLTIESNNSEYKVNIDCHILPEVTKILPSTFLSIETVPFPTQINLADPTFNVPSVVDILVGAEVFWNVLGHSSIDLGKNQPKLRETLFGWILTGVVPIGRPVGSSKQQKQVHYCNFLTPNNDSELTRFWELDTIPLKHSLSQEERACEESFAANTFRNSEGRFVVTMPLKTDPSALGDSYTMAKRRFLSLEKRFDRDSTYKRRYLDFMTEYESLGHMTESKHPVDHSETNYFLPHHGIVRESVTTKQRTVFDASMATSTGVSLNDLQMVGPTVQDDLLSILLRFRQHRYVISSDVEKMYRCIALNPSQRSLQQIIFRENPQEPLKTYKLNTLTYGTSSAPYLATKCLVSLADVTTDDRAKAAIKRDFYVDDFLSGGDTIEETVELCKEVDSILSSAHFHLRKWQCNNKDILSKIADVSSQSSSNVNFTFNTSSSSKTLGLLWVCNADTLSYSINIELKPKITKRHILSVISQIFDPLGLLGPCVVESKIIMQMLWVNKCDWDSEIPNDIKELWLSFANTLPCLNNIKIPRWVLNTDTISRELHIFSDSSEKAYGTSIYMRSIDGRGSITVRLLVSKNHIAPIKPTTIPRLELCAALLGARLFTKVIDSLTTDINACYFWCDSTIVLGWLATPPSRLKPFVRNRVDEIQESTSGHTWGYVPSGDNPADIVSRGLRADHISDCLLWWSGPSFLQKNHSHWPKMPNQNIKDLPEVVCSHIDINNDPIQSNQTTVQTLIQNHSKLTYLQRVLAYIYRFMYNMKNKHNKRNGHLTAEELKHSLICLLHHAQLEMFPNEYKLLASGKSLPGKNRLLSLTPFLDDDNIIRVGGRLNNALFDYSTKHPILLCSKHHLTKLIFERSHKELIHAGPQLLLATIRQNYWPLGGRNLAKSVVRTCLKCFRYKAKIVQPIMGQLPLPRTNLEFPFLHTSVDYAGPVLVADRKGRGCRLIKSYLCIFVCLAVKAVHIELVTDLTKEAYMSALKRFVARRGKPQTILSDNGTNFVGACNELLRFLQSCNIASDMAQEGIEFSFVPPYSPHFNGLAEAAVRSTKAHLRKLLQLTHFTYEELATFLAQIEAILNSRPLVPLSTDPLDFSALTPSHFLIGRSLLSIPHPQVLDANIGRQERFQRVEYLKQQFWKRFNSEYISLLQQKTKWLSSTGKLDVGTLVLIKDKTQPPLLWLLGRVVKIFPGGDGVARVVELKTKKGAITRGFQDVCPLPMD